MLDGPKKFEEYNRAEVCGQKVLKVEIKNLYMSITGFRLDLCPNSGNTLKVKTLQTPYSDNSRLIKSLRNLIYPVTIVLQHVLTRNIADERVELVRISYWTA